MKLNYETWNTARIETETTIREAKSRRTESHQPRWVHGPDDWKLTQLKGYATHLYRVRASLKGKSHDVPLDEKAVAGLFDWAIQQGLVVVPQPAATVG